MRWILLTFKEPVYRHGILFREPIKAEIVAAQKTGRQDDELHRYTRSVYPRSQLSDDTLQWHHQFGSLGSSPVTVSGLNNPVISNNCTGLDAQGTFMNGNIRIYNKCLDVTNGNDVNVQKLQIYTCSQGNINQLFQYQDDHIAWARHGRCFDVADGNLAPGNPTNQRFSWQNTTTPAVPSALPGSVQPAAVPASAAPVATVAVVVRPGGGGGGGGVTATVTVMSFTTTTTLPGGSVTTTPGINTNTTTTSNGPSTIVLSGTTVIGGTTGTVVPPVTTAISGISTTIPAITSVIGSATSVIPTSSSPVLPLALLLLPV
ncbi:hypothetical protein D9758_007226 [Tetrapyrgos nigripes]|uniref:Ricin B lectin domain-containing protein n=1 Tax=Tetrapyrgos nigripes TaxID=182062 RepID=A0A8H5FWI7_9AGAR|nr:hypothetical protein D9758_007226 [Tetrapyrgos nigripes]